MLLYSTVGWWYSLSMTITDTPTRHMPCFYLHLSLVHSETVDSLNRINTLNDNVRSQQWFNLAVLDGTDQITLLSKQFVQWDEVMCKMELAAQPRTEADWGVTTTISIAKNSLSLFIICLHFIVYFHPFISYRNIYLFIPLNHVERISFCILHCYVISLCFKGIFAEFV